MLDGHIVGEVATGRGAAAVAEPAGIR